jgi:hypothetical protein
LLPEIAIGLTPAGREDAGDTGESEAGRTLIAREERPQIAPPELMLIR